MAKINYYSERLAYEAVRFSRLFSEKKLFIHIPKAAGMTIRRSFKLAGRIQPISPNLLVSKKYYENLLDTMSRNGDHHGCEHARYRDVSPTATAGNRAFAVIRNPWDRVASRYYFAKQVIEVERKYESAKHNIRSFEEFLEERHIWGEKPYMWHRAIRGWYPCLDYVVDTKGAIAVDVLAFENLNQELETYFGLDNMDRARNVTAARKGTSIKKLYTPRTIQIVADWYQRDIEAFGYDFLSPPIKNTLYSGCST